MWSNVFWVPLGRALTRDWDAPQESGRLVNSCNPSSVSWEGRDHKSCDRSRKPKTPLSPRTRTGTNKTNVFILNGKPRGVYQDEGSAASGAALFVPLYFNKHQTQTRLGASSLQNVREGSAISHNKWAHANSGVFTMHNSVFGEHCADAGRWYAIILKSIRIRARHRGPERAFVFTGAHAGAEKITIQE